MFASVQSYGDQKGSSKLAQAPTEWCIYGSVSLFLLQENVRRTFSLMSQRGLVRTGDLVVVVTDLRPAGNIIRSVQVRHVQ